MCPGPPGGGDDLGAGAAANLSIAIFRCCCCTKCDIHLLTNPCGQVDHPYSAILKYTKCLKGNKAKSQVRKLRRGEEHMASGWCLCNNAGAEQFLVSMVLVVDHHWWCW
jgi:hypothetical protein